MAKNTFFAMINRLKLINRWALMRSTRQENNSEHSHHVAVVAHALALIGNKHFGKSYSSERAAVLALYHDATEIITGDMPTPVKYYNDAITTAYKGIESMAADRLLNLLPDELRADYSTILHKAPGDEAEWQLVHAADKICAYIKCTEELNAGNSEFSSAAAATKQKLDGLQLPEAQYFITNLLPAYSQTLDEHTK